MTCAATNNSKRLTAKEAHAILEEVKNSELDPGQKWYLISKEWWDSFIAEQDKYKCELLSEITLPPISNEKLVQAPNNKYSNSATEYKLKENLVEEVDYTLVPEKQFSVLKDRFGVENKDRDVISRPVVVGTVLQKEPFVEVYPLKLKVAKFNRRDDVKTLEVSYADSFDELKTKAFDLLHITKDQRELSQILVEKSDNDFEAISEKLTAGLDSILRMDMVFYVDDGSKSLRSSSRATDEMNGNTRRSGYYGSAAAERERFPAGLCGLQNLGNTCFMNSALQCLSNTPELTEYFLSDRVFDEINASNVLGTGGRLAKAYTDLIKNLWSGNNSAVKPYEFKCVIGQFAPRFNGYAQQDAQELMAFLLDGLHEDLNRIFKKPYIEEKESDGRPDHVVAKEAWDDYKKRNDSIIVDLMHGQLKSTVVCNVCGKVSIKFDPFCFLSIPVPTKEKAAKSSIAIFHAQQWKKISILHTNKTLVKHVVAALRKELQLGDSKDRIILVSTTGQVRNILDEESVMPYNTYTVYSQPRTIAAYVVKPGPLLMVENVAPNSYQRFVTYPIVINYKHALTRNNLLHHVAPMIQDRFWRESVKQKDQAMSSKEVSSVFTEALKDIFVDNPKLSQIPMPANPDEAVDVKEARYPPSIAFHWKDTVNFIPPNQFDNNIEDGGEINLQQAGKRQYTLEECIEMFTSREQLDENEAWYCPQCKTHQCAFKKLDVWKLPKILIVHLKRFQYTRYSREKIDTDIVIPVRNFSPCDKVANQKHEPVAYDLVAISNHMGGLGSGHYTAKAFLKTNKQWCDFNDSSAMVSSDLPDPLISREAYILVYRQRNEPAPQPQRTSGRVTRRSKMSESEPMDTSEH